MTEAEYLAQRIAELRVFFTETSRQADSFVKETENQIQMLIEEAGIAHRIQAIRKEAEQTQRQLALRKSNMSARIEELEKVLDQFHRFPVAPGTVIHGIDVSKLDWQTRARVMSGDYETITALGGTLHERPVERLEEAEIVETSNQGEE